jgi:hypothetical protein
MEIQEWETYKDFRIVPHLLCFEGDDPETGGKWIAAEVDILQRERSDPIKTVKLKGVYASTKQEAFHLAVDQGKKEVDTIA